MDNKITIKYGLRVKDIDSVEISVKRLIELIKSKQYDNKPIIEYFGGGLDGLNQKIHPYFDIDIDRTSLDKVQTTTLQPDGTELVDYIEPTFTGFFNTATNFICQEFKTTHEMLKISTGHRPEKYSCHIIIPSITTTLQDMINWKHARGKELSNHFVDSCVYRKGGLRMVGTSKVGKKSPLMMESGKIEDLPDHLVTNVTPESPITWTCEASEKQLTLKEIQKEEKIKEKIENKLEQVSDLLDQTEFDLPEQLTNEINILLSLLSPDRCDLYNEWIQVGICLNNTVQGFELWENWSRQSTKFQEGVCQTKWNTFVRQSRPNINTLRFWAHFDSPEDYETEYVKVQLDKYLKNIFIKNGSTTSIADLINLLHGKKFRSVIRKSDIDWYVFQGHRWFIYENDSVSDIIIRNEIKSLLTTYYYQLLTQLKESPSDTLLNTLIEKAKKVMLQIEDVRFRQKCALDFAMLVCQKDFAQKLDVDFRLMCFENGVYDFKTQTFRNGKPEDYLTLTTGYDYRDFDQNDEIFVEIYMFLQQLFPQTDDGEYLLLDNTMKLLGSFLCDGNNLQKFHIWTGKGRNGKSAILKLVQMCLGEYARNIPIAHLTQKQYQQTGAPCPDIIRLKGAKLVYTCEPEEGAVFNLGVIKNWTGQDRITARNLFDKNLTDFQANFATVTFCNIIPKMIGVTDADKAILERWLITPFVSFFTKTPDPKNTYEFQINTQLESQKFPLWKQAFMYMMIVYANQFIQGGSTIKTLSYNIDCVNAYRAEGSVFHQFMENGIIKTTNKDDFITLNDLWEQFKHDKLYNSKINKKSCKEFFTKVSQFEERPSINGKQYSNVFRCLKWDIDETNEVNFLKENINSD